MIHRNRQFFFVNKILVFTVVSFHFLLLLCMQCKLSFKKEQQHLPIAVNTKIIKPAARAKKVVAKKTAVAATKRVTPQKKIQQQPVKKVVAKNTKLQNLADRLQASLHNKSDNKKIKQDEKQLVTPSRIEHLSVDTNVKNIEKIEDKQSHYRDLFIQDLQNHLHLPEYGSVKMRIKVTEGNIDFVQTLETQSKKNENYLKNTLPRLTFPWFNQYFSEQKQYEFIVIFKNEN